VKPQDTGKSKRKSRVELRIDGIDLISAGYSRIKIIIRILDLIGSGMSCKEKSIGNHLVIRPRSAGQSK
jgi:hypothetical protein